jgi:hypothetical protein
MNNEYSPTQKQILVFNEVAFININFITFYSKEMADLDKLTK